MGIYNTNKQWTTYRILDATIMNVDVAAAANIGVGKLNHTALIGDTNTGTVTWIGAAGDPGAAGGITTGAGLTGNNVGGNLTLTAGLSIGAGIGAKVDINAGAGGATGVGGAVEITAGAAGGDDKAGGAIDIDAGAGHGSEPGGNVLVNAGTAGATGTGGGVTITSGTATAGAGGAIGITASPGVGGANVGGDVTITAGASIGAGVGGDIQLTPGDSASGVAGSVLVGANTAGHDVKLFGATTDGAYAEFDASADKMNFVKSSIEMTGVITEGLASPYIGIGTSAAPIEITTFADHVLGIGAWFKLKSNVAKSLLGGYFKVETDGSTEVPLAQLVAVAPRVTVDMNLDSAYGVQSHMTVSGTKTSSELISVSAYVSLGTGARTADRVCALQAMLDGSGTAGTVVGDATVARIVNAGTVITTDQILNLVNQASATCTQMMLLEQNEATPANFPDGIIHNTQWLKTAFEAKSYLATADEGILLTVNETGTHTSDVTGIKVAMTKMSGAITGAGQYQGISSEIQLRANSNHNYAYSAYTGISGTPTLGDLSAFHCYCDNLGGTAANVNEYQCLDLNINSTNEASGSTNGNAFFRLYAHGARPTSIFRLADATGMDNLFWFQQTALPVSAGSDSTNCTHKIALIIGGGNTTTHYLHVFSD